jgi:hypothetical protein
MLYAHTCGAGMALGSLVIRRGDESDERQRKVSKHRMDDRIRDEER